MTNGISAAELEQMRSDIEQLFPDTCNILVPTYTSDGAGGNTETWGTITNGTAVPCRVDYKAGRESVTAGAITPYQQAVISLAHGVIITAANRIVVGTDTFSVQANNAGQSWKAVTRVSVELVP
jgi:head-tail adaptor